MSTVFSQKRWEFTKKAHAAAERQFYPLMYPAGVAFEDTTNTAHDLEYAIDCQLAVTIDGLRAPIRMSVQERFRKPEEMHWGDITVTEWNLDTDQPSEMHKLGAQLFVYGFYDEPADRITLALTVDVGLMQWALANRKITWKRNSRGDQSFLGFDFKELDRIGAVLFIRDFRERTG